MNINKMQVIVKVVKLNYSCDSVSALIRKVLKVHPVCANLLWAANHIRVTRRKPPDRAAKAVCGQILTDVSSVKIHAE